MISKRTVITKELLDALRKTIPSQIAQEINSVQPIDPTLFGQVLAEAKSEQWLIENGYEPVSYHGLLWIKKEKQNESDQSI